MNIKKYKLNKLLYITLTVSLLIGFISLTDPYKIPLPLIIIPFLLSWFALYEVVLLVMTFRNPSRNISYMTKIIPISVASLGVSLLLLATLHQLTWKDTFLILILALVFWGYIRKADFLRK